MVSEKRGDLRFSDFLAKKMLGTFLYKKMPFLGNIAMKYPEFFFVNKRNRKYLLVFTSYQNFMDLRHRLAGKFAKKGEKNGKKTDF